MMALRLACDEKHVFAGVAILGASLPSDLETSCRPPRPVPLLLIAGTADPVVPYHGGTVTLPHGKTETLSVDKTLSLFGKAAGCAGGTITTAFPDKDPHDGTRAYLDRLSNCAVPVEAVRIEGASHALPNGDVSSAKLVRDFFRSLGG
jgi:polyhydroxybutyrate depolymerase